MSLLSLSKSLTRILPKKNFFSHKFKTNSLKLLKKIEIFAKVTPNLCSLKLLKKIVFLCNYKFTNENGKDLDLAESLLMNSIKGLNPLQIPGSIRKLLIITLINQSKAYEKTNSQKAIQSIIQAIKVCNIGEFKSSYGKLLKFIAKLRQCELCVSSKKFEIGVSVAQEVLTDVLWKREKNDQKEVKKELAMVAINAFYLIGLCEEGRGCKKSAESAFENANTFGKVYLTKDNILDELDLEDAQRRQSPRKRVHTPRTSHIKNSSDDGQSPKVPKLNLFSPEKKQVKSPLSGLQKNSEKIPGRYYSNEKLQNLTKLLFEKRDPIVLNSDNYFYSHISKALGIGENLNEKVDDVSKQVKEHIIGIGKSKENLKSRKKAVKFMLFKDMSNDLVSKRINRIEYEFESKLRTKEIKMKSKLKSKVYRKLLQSINIPSFNNKRDPPDQKIFFKQPATRRVSEKNLDPRPAKPTPLEKNINVEELNQEIEEQLEELYQDINSIPSIPTSPTNHDLPSCILAKSTIRSKTIQSGIKKSISGALFGGLRKILQK